MCRRALQPYGVDYDGGVGGAALEAAALVHCGAAIGRSARFRGTVLLPA